MIFAGGRIRTSVGTKPSGPEPDPIDLAMGLPLINNFRLKKYISQINFVSSESKDVLVVLCKLKCSKLGKVLNC